MSYLAKKENLNSDEVFFLKALSIAPEGYVDIGEVSPELRCQQLGYYSDPDALVWNLAHGSKTVRAFPGDRITGFMITEAGRKYLEKGIQ